MNLFLVGWIYKFINEFFKKEFIDSYSGLLFFYEMFKKSGFIYGVLVKIFLDVFVSDLKFI